MDGGGAIEVEGLTKRYGDTTAIEDLSLSVPAGEIFGLLGPNGAGKSTLINALCTLVAPSEGRASVAGHDVAADPGGVRRSIGVVFQEPALDEELTGAENLAFHGRLYGMREPRRSRRIDRVLELVDLDDRRDDPVGEYSGGMQRRLELARGLLHDPAVLFLDEPTVGLDAGTRRDTREYVRALNERTGATVVFTTHYMEEAAALCDRVAIVDRGRVVACDDPDSLVAGLGGDTVEVGVAGDPGPVADRLRAFGWVSSASVAGDGVEAVVDDGPRRVAAVVAAAEDAGEVRTVTVRRPTLEAVFLKLTGRTVAAAEADGRNRDREGGGADGRDGEGGGTGDRTGTERERPGRTGTDAGAGPASTDGGGPDAGSRPGDRRGAGRRTGTGTDAAGGDGDGKGGDRR